MDNNNFNFGKFLRNTRIKAGYKTQKQLSDVSGVSQTTLSRIEAGTQKPLPETLKALSPYLRPFTYGELLDRAGYFKDLREPLIDFFDTHDELDMRIADNLDVFSENNEFYPNIKNALKFELTPLFESEGVQVEITPKGIRNALRELDPDIDFKNEFLQAFERAKSIEFRNVILGDIDITDGVKDKKLSEEEILTLAAHQVGHEGPLTEEQLAQIKLAMKIALAKNDK